MLVPKQAHGFTPLLVNENNFNTSPTSVFGRIICRVHPYLFSDHRHDVTHFADTYSSCSAFQRQLAWSCEALKYSIATHNRIKDTLNSLYSICTSLQNAQVALTFGCCHCLVVVFLSKLIYYIPNTLKTYSISHKNVTCFSTQPQWSGADAPAAPCGPHPLLDARLHCRGHSIPAGSVAK